MTWKFHVADSTERRYDIILGRYLLTELVPDLKFSKKIIVGGDIPYEGCLAPMYGVTDYDFKPLMEKLSNQKNNLLICMSKNASSQKEWLVQPKKCVEY